jgi:amino acid transporter
MTESTTTDDRAGSPGRPRPASLRAAALGPLNVLAIAIAAISPTTSVFLVYGAGLGSAGTGVVWAFVIGGVIAVSMALCYAEVGSVFPSAGGAYTIVRRALGPVAGGVAVVLFLLLGLVLTASILVSAATYLSSLIPGGLPVGWTAFAMMVLVTALSMGRVSPASWVAGAMLALEITVVLVFTGVAFAHWSGQTAPFTHPVVPAGSGGLTHTVGSAGLLAAVVPALFAFNGYDWPLYFVEEARGSRRTGPRAVLLAAVIAVVVELLAVTAATGAIRHLGATAADDSPLSLIARQVLGGTGAKIIIAGVVVAMFDTGLAGNLAYARVYYAAARDGLLPGPLGRFFGSIAERSQVPVLGFLFLFAGNGVLCLFTSLNNLITFSGVMIVVVYLLVAVSALVCRVRDRGLPRAFRMWLWPLPPLIALAGGGLALSQQDARDLYIAFGVAAAALVGYLLAARRLPQRLEPRPPAPDEPAADAGSGA